MKRSMDKLVFCRRTEALSIQLEMGLVVGLTFRAFLTQTTKAFFLQHGGGGCGWHVGLRDFKTRRGPAMASSVWGPEGERVVLQQFCADSSTYPLHAPSNNPSSSPLSLSPFSTLSPSPFTPNHLTHFCSSFRVPFYSLLK
jgi:hypothetical protein